MASNVRGVWAYKWWIAAITIVATIAAYGVASRLPTSYSASSLAQVISGPEQAGTYVDQNALLQLTNYYLAQAQTTPVAGQAAASLGGGTTATRVHRLVSVSSVPDSQELKFSATSPNSRDAARYANAYAQAFAGGVANQQRAASQTTLAGFQNQIAAVENQIAAPNVSPVAVNALTTELQALQTQAATAAGRPLDAINIIQRATPPTAASSPKPKEDAALVFLLVLLLSCAAAYGRATFSDRYRSADEVVSDTGMAFLGEIPLLAVSDPAAVEAFQSLRTVVEFVAHDLSRPSFVVTSARAGAGKTHVVLNLAGALAAGERQVVLVDGDLRRPTVHERLGLNRAPGLSDMLAEETGRARDFENGTSEAHRSPGRNGSALATTTDRAPRGPVNGSDNGNDRTIGGQPAQATGSLDVVTAGTPLSDPVNVLNSTITERVTAGLRHSYEMTLFDSPPMSVADATVLARGASGVILIIDARHDRRVWVRHVVERLQSLNLHVGGFVFNGTSAKGLVDGYYPQASPPSSERGVKLTAEPSAESTKEASTATHRASTTEPT